MKQVINYSIILTIFLDDFILFNRGFNLYGYYAIYLLFVTWYLVRHKTLQFPRAFFLLLTLFSAIGLANTLLDGAGSNLVIKQFLVIFFNALTFYLLIKNNERDIINLFYTYLNISYYVCILGILQEVTYLVGYPWPYEYKITSIVSEPAHLAIAITPALFYSIAQVLKLEKLLLGRYKMMMIILAYLLTFSAVAFIGLALCIVLILLSKSILNGEVPIGRKFVVLVSSTVSCLLLVLLVYQISPIRLRIDDTLAVLKADRKIPVDEINLSSFVWYSHYFVAKETLKDNFLLGTGLGTHAINYDQHIDKIISPQHPFRIMALNREDANSLLFRLLSETGILGVLIFCFFIYHYGISYRTGLNDEELILWLINKGILVSILLRLLRFGNYTVLGFFFFVFLYIISYKYYKINQANITPLSQPG